VPASSLEGTDEQTFDQLFSVNVKGPFFLTQRAVERIRENGRIIDVSTILTRIGNPQTLTYATLLRDMVKPLTSPMSWLFLPRMIVAGLPRKPLKPAEDILYERSKIYASIRWASCQRDHPYRNSRSLEINGHIETLLTLGRFDASMMPHEDYEGIGAYLYELNDTLDPGLGGKIIAAMGLYLPIELRPEIEEWAARGGVISGRDLIAEPGSSLKHSDLRSAAINE
jgi:hypothetical protein